MIVILFCFCTFFLLYLCFVIVSVSVYNVFVLCVMLSGSTLVQVMPFGATHSSLTNQITIDTLPIRYTMYGLDVLKCTNLAALFNLAWSDSILLK